MKITGLTLKSGNAVRTAIQFTDGVFEYETHLIGNYYNSEHYILEQGLLDTLTEYELIECMIDEEAKAERIFEMEELDRLTEQMKMDWISEQIKGWA